LPKSGAPTPKEHKFATEVLKHSTEMSTSQAAQIAYKEVYDPKKVINDQAARSMGMKVLNRPQVKALVDALQQGVRYQFILMAPAAQERLEDLAVNAKSEKVKLDANIEILDRAGFKPPEKVELATVGIFGSASPDEIREVLRQNLAAIDAEIGAKA
jgi:hypothetical protein